MKQAKISKVLALVLACVMVFTTLPLFAFAADESETYTVSYGAPAILMNTNTKVNLADISVEMDAEGTTVSGADITWAAAEQDGITLNAAAKTIIALAKGAYKLTATYNGTTKNVWVMVKEAAEEKFYFVNIPLFNSGSFTADNWRIFSSINNTDVTVSDALTNGIITLTNDYVQISHKYSETDSSLKKGSTIVYVDEIFKDFADYTVEASVSSGAANSVSEAGAGVGGRVTLNEKETGFTTGILSYIRQTKVPAITRINNDFGPHGTAVTTTPYTTWSGYAAYHTVKTIYDGNHFTYYYDTDMLYEHSSTPPSCTCTNTRCIFRNTIPGAGYPAVVGFGATARIKSFAVYLNNNELAPATAVNYYTVDYAAPAIPMNVDTAVDLGFINVEMDAEGTVALGSEIIWDAERQDGLFLNKETNKVSVYNAGVYKLTATAGGITKNVWVVARKTTADKFYLINMPELNKNTFVKDNWRVMGSANNTDVTVAEAIDAGYLVLGDGYVRTAQAFGTTSDLKKGGTLVYVNEIFKDFADYTVEAEVSSNGAATVDGVGAGVGGRVALNDKETGFTTGVLSYIRQSRVAAIYRINNDFGPHGTAIAKDENNKWYTWTGVEDYHTVKTVHAGNAFSFCYDDESVYNYTSTPGTCTCTNANCIFKHTIPAEGYPALVGFGATTNFKSFYVYLNDVEIPEATAAELVENVKVSVNSVADLANVGFKFGNKTIAGHDVNIDNVRTEYGEVSNGKFVAFKVGEVTATANYNGMEASITIKVVDDGTDTVNSNKIADDSIVIEPAFSSATDSTYYVTVKPDSGKQLASLGLSIYEKGEKLSSYAFADNTGNKFVFETLGIEHITITAEYVDEASLSVAPIGATVRVADANKGVTAGIKFGNRVNVVTTNGNAVTLKDTTNIKIGDTLIENVTIKEVGTLIIPTVLMDGELLYTTKNVKRGKATAVSAATAQCSDITAVLVNIPEKQYNLAISARAYVAYTLEGDNTVYYYYGDVIERTYNDVYTAAQPARHYYNETTGKYGELIVDDGTIQDNTEKTIKVEQLLEGGTDHYLDALSETDDISYMTGETITYAFRIKGGYKLRYMVYKDNAEDNLYGNEEIGIDTKSEPKTNKYVKQGVYEGDVFKFSTKMNKAGAIEVKLEVLDSNDKVVSMFRHTIIVDFDNIEPAVEAPTYYYDEDGTKVESTVAEFYAASKVEWAPMLAKIREEVNSDEFKAYWSAKAANAVYDGTYIYAERKGDVNDYYLYDIYVATEEPSKVVAGATKVSDLFADATNKKFLYNDHTVRPASFNLTLRKTSVDGTLGVTGSFQGYGDAASASKATSDSALFVNMNSHGILNNQDSAYYTAIHKVKSLEGGTKGFFNEFNPTDNVGTEKSPTELYAYGIVKRDHFGLQFAKMLPEYNTDSRNAVSGASMGGFRSIMAAAFDNSIKKVDCAYTWMGSIGGRENGKVAGGFMPAYTIGIQYFSIENAVATFGSDVTLNLSSCGLGDYTSPPAGLVAAYNAATCKKSIMLRQYREHGTARTITHYDMKRSAEAAAVEYEAMPEGFNGATISEEEMLNAYRGHTEWRIYSIKTAADEIKPAAGGTAYYFSSKGSSLNDGLSPQKPLRTLEDLTNLESKLKAGDVVYFERGSIFRGSYTASVDGVTYAAYGEGPKPEIYASRVDAAKVGKWVPTEENKNVYVYIGGQKYGTDVGNIVFNGGEKHGIKCIIRTEDDGTYNNTTGRRFDTYADLDENLHFFHDTEDTDNLYLYCEDGNPGEIFESIEICVGTHIFIIRANNLRFDNISFKYGGGHGISANTRKNLTITNCEFQWLGGSIQKGVQFAKNYPTRFGNGVEIYGGCNGFTVKNCFFNQIYDAAATFQYSNKEATDIAMQNIEFSDNVMQYCNYSFEYFLTTSDMGTGSYIKDVKVENNLMWYAGYGLCEQRPDKVDAAHVKAWEHNNYLKGTFTITNNLFAISRTDLVQSNAKDASHSPTYSGNTYIQYTGGNLGTSRDVWDKVLFDSSAAAQIASMLGDNKSTVVYVQK